MDAITKIVSRVVAPMRVRIANMVARAVIYAVDDARKVQELQLATLPGEVRSEIERFQEYGFTSVPKPGAEAVIVFVGGKREHGLAIGVEDRRYRIRNLESGEVAIHDCTGTSIVLKANGDIEITPSSGKVKITGDLEASGALTAGGEVTARNVTPATKVTLGNHIHPSNGAPPTPGN